LVEIGGYHASVEQNVFLQMQLRFDMIEVSTQFVTARVPLGPGPVLPKIWVGKLVEGHRSVYPGTSVTVPKPDTAKVGGVVDDKAFETGCPKLVEEVATTKATANNDGIIFDCGLRGHSEE